MPMKNHIRDLIDRKGISVYQFRKDTGIASRTAYDLYNKPEHLPSPDVLRKICDAYEVQPGVILEWVPKTKATAK